MILRRASLVSGSLTKIGIGTTSPSRGLVRIDGTTTPAIIKHLQPEAIASECYAALVLIEWGVPVPEPLLVDDGTDLFFGSHEQQYPNLKQRLGWRDGMSQAEINALEINASKTIATFKETPIAIAADEAIANHDRNIENILWDGAEPFFIDHERAFGQHTTDLNKLAMMAIISGDHLRIEQSALTAALTLATKALQEAANTMMSVGIDADMFKEYVEKRLPKLGNRIIDRFPKPQDLFTT